MSDDFFWTLRIWNVPGGENDKILDAIYGAVGGDIPWEWEPDTSNIIFQFKTEEDARSAFDAVRELGYDSLVEHSEKPA